MRRFLSRYPDGGGQALVINPSSLSPAIYLSGLPNDGVTVSGGVLTHWFDKIANYNFTPISGSSGVSAFNDGSVGEPPGIWAVSACGGNFFRGWDAQGTLPGFSNANGYTQYILVGGVSANNYGESVFRWPVGANGMNWVYQAPGFDGGGNFWPGHPVAAGNIALIGTNGAQDTGIATPTSQTTYDLWALVSDASTNTTLYRNGVKGPTLNNGVMGLSTNLTFGGPSAGTSFVCTLISSYLLYTAQHTPGQIAGVHAWYRAKYGAS